MDGMYRETQVPMLNEPITQTMAGMKEFDDPAEGYSTGSFALDALLGIKGTRGPYGSDEKDD